MVYNGGKLDQVSRPGKAMAKKTSKRPSKATVRGRRHLRDAEASKGKRKAKDISSSPETGRGRSEVMDEEYPLTRGEYFKLLREVANSKWDIPEAAREEIPEHLSKMAVGEDPLNEGEIIPPALRINASQVVVRMQQNNDKKAVDLIRIEQAERLGVKTDYEPVDSLPSDDVISMDDSIPREPDEEDINGSDSAGGNGNEPGSVDENKTED